MRLFHILRLSLALIAAALASGAAHAQTLEKRIALVIGNGAYQTGPLASAANDAGLIAQTLQAAGFDVTGARDLDGGALRASFKEFAGKAAQSGPGTVALVYFAGHGRQFEGENYLIPVDARLANEGDVPLESLRVSDMTKALAALPLKARIIILDAGRGDSFPKSARPPAGGLALAQPEVGTLIAFNAAPGTIAPESMAAYGAYASALAEMIKTGGLPLDEMFERVRLRVNELTAGAEVTWHASRIDAPFVFFERTQAAPEKEDQRFSELRTKPVRDFDARDAFLAALARDTVRGYEEFLNAYPDDPMAKRARAILAARREATVWRESAVADTPEAYWSYLRRYPRGPHGSEARRRLTHFAAAFDPPPEFQAIAYDIGPPPPEEIIYIERPAVYFADPIYDFAPPPPVPVFFLAPRPVYFIDLAPPPPPVYAFVLPFPVYYPVPVWVERPVYVAPPPVNVIVVNIHNTVVVNQINNTATVTNPAGQLVPAIPANPAPPPALPPAGGGNFVQTHPGASAAALGAAVALPLALRSRAQAARPAAAPGAAPPRALPLPKPSAALPPPAVKGVTRLPAPGNPQPLTAARPAASPPAAKANAQLPPRPAAARQKQAPPASAAARPLPPTAAPRAAAPNPAAGVDAARLRQFQQQRAQQQAVQQRAQQANQQRAQQQQAAQRRAQQVSQQRAQQQFRSQPPPRQPAAQPAQRQKQNCGRPGEPVCR